MRKLAFSALKCNSMNGVFGDDCRLEVYTDGQLQRPLKHHLKEGDIWHLTQQYNFRGGVVVKLWSADSDSLDDLVGTLSLGPITTRCGEAIFLKDDANYSLHFGVAECSTPRDPVLEAIQSFEQSTHSSRWPHINKNVLLDDLKQRAAFALRVYQGTHTGLCGPAAIVYELVSRNPRRYVEMLRELFETGRFQARTKWYAPSDDCLNSDLTGDVVSPADWMLIAALREEENIALDVTPDSGDLTGMTYTGAMETWIFEILGYDHHHDDVDNTSPYSDELNDLVQANEIRNTEGGVAFLLIHSGLLTHGDAGVFPDHWVSFVDKFSLAANRLKYTCYSWAGIYTIDMQIDNEGHPYNDYHSKLVWGKNIHVCDVVARKPQALSWLAALLD